MESKLNITKPLLEKAEQLVLTSYQLLRLKAIDKAVKIVSGLFSNGLVILVFCMAILFVNMALALWLGHIFGKLYFGFFCVAGLYLLIGMVLYFLLHKRMKKYFSDFILSKII